MVTLLTKNDCDLSFEGKSFAGHIVILDLSQCGFKEEYNNAKFQLFYAESGFGCDPDKMGNGVFGYFVADKEYCRVERHQVIGVISKESLEEWKKVYPDVAENATYFASKSEA